MPFEGVTCPQCKADKDLTQVEPDTFYCPYHKGLFKYVQPSGPVAPRERLLCSCRTFAIGYCSDCDSPVCGDCSSVVDGQRVCRPCGGRRTKRAQDAAKIAREAEMAALPPMLQAVAEAPSRAALLSLRSAFPPAAARTQGFLGRGPAVPPGWPRKALDAGGTNLVAAVANSATSQHDLVSFRARDKGRLILGAVDELSRAPVVLLPNGMALALDGDVLVPSFDRVDIGQDKLTVVARNRRVRLTGYQPFSMGSWGSDSDPAHYRQVLPGPIVHKAASFLWMHWQDLLTAMASTLS